MYYTNSNHEYKNRSPRHFPGVKQSPDAPKNQQDSVFSLSRYFKSKYHGYELDNNIVEKLEHSAWDHIHSAIRARRQGNSQKAEMHLAIAGSACNELSRYLPKDQFLKFNKEIKAYAESNKVQH